MKGDLKNLQVRWHVPSDLEVDMATLILEKCLLEELGRLAGHRQGEQVLDR